MNNESGNGNYVRPLQAVLTNLRALEAAATPGYWCVDEGPAQDDPTYIHAGNARVCPVAMILSSSAASRNRADAAFIVGAVAFARASLQALSAVPDGGERIPDNEPSPLGEEARNGRTEWEALEEVISRIPVAAGGTALHAVAGLSAIEQIARAALAGGSSTGQHGVALDGDITPRIPRVAIMTGDPLRSAVLQLLRVLQDARSDDEVTPMTQAGGYLLGDVMSDAIDDVVVALEPAQVAPVESEKQAQGAEELERDPPNGAVATTTYTVVIAETHVVLTTSTVTADSIEMALAKAKSGEILDSVVTGTRGVVDRTVEELKVYR